ncbi:MAG: PASTA domain-containing protein [Gemmatimonadaceae bacterium]|jgi:hypothetical protein|nr:PASTA domain-containing protein [Gemmatimonadaceae bacterium]
MRRLSLPRGLPARLLALGGIGLVLGALGASAIMLWLTRGPVTRSRVEDDAQARARDRAAESVAVMTAPVASPGPSTASAPAPEPPPPDSAIGIAPSIVGLSEGAARTLIVAAGFEVGSISSAASDRPIGEVIGTFPEAGERVPLPASINLIVSGGPAPARPDSAQPPDTLHRPAH